jgi:hypothetical protein
MTRPYLPPLCPSNAVTCAKRLVLLIALLLHGSTLGLAPTDRSVINCRNLTGRLPTTFIHSPQLLLAFELSRKTRCSTSPLSTTFNFFRLLITRPSSSQPPPMHISAAEKAALLTWYDEAGGDDWCCVRDETTEPWSDSTEPCPDENGYGYRDGYGDGGEHQGGPGSAAGSVADWAELVGEGVGYESSRWLGIKCVNSSVTEIDLSDCCVSGQWVVEG